MAEVEWTANWREDEGYSVTVLDPVTRRSPNDCDAIYDEPNDWIACILPFPHTDRSHLGRSSRGDWWTW